MTGADLRAIRERLGLTLDGLAEALSDPRTGRQVGRMTVWRWEQPETSPHHRDPPPYLWRALRDLEREQKRTGAS